MEHDTTKNQTLQEMKQALQDSACGKESLLATIHQTPELLKKWNSLSPELHQYFFDVAEGIRVPNLLMDSVFKGIFDPDRHKDRLSRLISSILGFQVTVVSSLKNEGTIYSQYSKGIILDITVRLKDGSLANVEIQRQGWRFPSKRAVVYSCDMIARQYAVSENQKKTSMDFDNVQPVYTIILMEKSYSLFQASDKYVHHFCQRSDTGLELEFLQYYHFICLDIFRRQQPNLAGELETWLRFLSIETTEEMALFLLENKSFQTLYNCAILMTKDAEEMMNMVTDIWANEDIAASLNQSNETRIKQLEAEALEKDKIILEKDQEIARLRSLLVEK